MAAASPAQNINNANLSILNSNGSSIFSLNNTSNYNIGSITANLNNIAINSSSDGHNSSVPLGMLPSGPMHKHTAQRSIYVT